MIIRLASKICPICGAKNPSTAYSCSNCAASLIDTSSSSFGSGPTTSSSWSMPRSTQDTSYTRSPDLRGVGQTSTPLSVGGQPLAVVQQSPLRSIINALITVAFVVFFGIGLGLTSYGALVSIAVLAAIISIPVILGFLFRPRFEFYDSYFLRATRRNRQQIDYSEIKSAEKYRSSIRIELKAQEGAGFGPRGVLIPGDPKLSDGTDLSAWLKSRITPTQPAKSENESPSELGLQASDVDQTESSTRIS
jgi:hypothetical protein